ncbi:MAG: M48 family metalloprotease [Pirellulaceae bacterium]|nr:M48 family metalloprotease [Pirellulaceae bacterium]
MSQSFSATSMGPTAAANSPLKTPTREELLAQLDGANRWGAVLVLAQSVAVLILALLVDWNDVLQQPLTSTIAIATIVGPFVMSILTFWAQNKKEIGDIKEQTRFGQFDKHQLRNLFQDTLRRLQLPDKRLPVYVVADKFTNAAMLHVGLGGFFKSLNGVYLHRQALHKFTPAEVQDVMGHELGHFYRYYLITDRFRIVTLALGVCAGLYAVQLIGLNTYVSYIVLVAIAGALWTLNSMLTARHIWAIEYLCDDLGAHVHGVTVSIAGLMKLGAEWEVLTAVQQQAAFSAHRGQLSAVEVAEAIAAAIPYGHATRAELEAAVEKSLKQKANQGPSIGGFLHYMWHGDDDADVDEEFEQQMKKLKALQNIPRIPWETLLAQPGVIEFDQARLAALIELIEQFPQAALFHTPEALGANDPMHPPLKLRILYLWRNRSAIDPTP